MVKLINESGYDFIITHPLSGKILGGYYQIETAVNSIKLGWDCELRWEMVKHDPMSCDAICMATNQTVARVTKVPMSSTSQALIL